MSEIHILRPANHGRPSSVEIGATVATVLRYAFLVAVAIFLILVLLPLALVAGGSAGASS